MVGKSIVGRDHELGARAQFLDAKDRDTLTRQTQRMRAVVGEIGPISVWTDLIADIECLLRGEPTLLRQTPNEWIACTKRLLRGPLFSTG